MNRPPGAQREPTGLARAVELTKRHLGLHVAFIAQVTDDGHVCVAAAGDTAAFGLSPREAVASVDADVAAGGVSQLSHGRCVSGYPSPPAGEQPSTFCRRLIAGQIPNVVADAAADDRTSELAALHGTHVGAFIGVPLWLSDGTPFGALCGLSRTPRPDLDDRDARFMAMLGEVIVNELDERRGRQLVSSEIVRLIETEDVQIAYQPMIDLHSRLCIGIEALARFPEPFDRPDCTLEIADTVGLRLELERLVIREAWKMIPMLGEGQFLALNVSPDALVELARRANQRDDLPLSRLVVEVTEHAIVDRYAPLLDELGPLRARGLRVAVDDAGAGYASLRHVLELRPDFIKLDRSLIHGIAHDRAQRVAVRAFHSLALDLRASVIAEGVERPEDLAVVRELGLQWAQGYLLGMPTTDAGELSRWIGAGAQHELASVPAEDVVHADVEPSVMRAPVPVASPPRSELRIPEEGVTSAWRRDHAGSGITSRLILSYVEREAGGHAVKQLLEHAGLSDAEDLLRDENCWFSYDTKLALWRAAEAVLEDDHVAEHAGEAVLDMSVAMALKRALRALGTPAFVYGNVVRANAKFNWAHELVVIDSGTDSVRVRYRDLAGVGYHRCDCQYTKGLLATVPQLFGLPQARVEHPVCGARGAGACEFDVRWTSGMHGLRRAALASACGAAALAVAGVIEPELLPVAGGIFVLAEAAIATRAVRFMRRRLRVLEQRVREQDDAAESLLASLQDLSSDLRLDEVLDQITGKAQSAIGGKEFALLLDDGDMIRVNRHSGVPMAALATLETWANARRSDLRDRGAVLIDDLATEPMLAELTRQERMPLGSMCAAPLVFADELLGMLVALAHGSTVFLPGEAATLSAYATHAAIALSNARLVDRLERQAAEDPLTGLANHRAFRRECEAEFSRTERAGTEVSIVMLDLDHFKAINDLHGHPFGDQVLIAVADALRAAVRAHDTVARLGGEEFAILLPDADGDAAYDLAERARAAIARIPVAHTPLACSAGAATASPVDTTPGELLELADRALYEAKRRGRDRTASGSGDGQRSSAA